MTKCPKCMTEMNKELKEIEPGINVNVEICPVCKDEWIDEKEYDKLVNFTNPKSLNDPSTSKISFNSNTIN